MESKAQFERTEMLFGSEGMERLSRCRVAVFGIGGVGGHAAEALARCGVGELDLIDNDTVALSNLNRQIIATHRTIGQYKVDAAAERLREICPEIKINKHKCFFMPDTADGFDFSLYDYVIDAIDTVTGKLEIIVRAARAGVPVISAMGAGNKLDPTMLRVADISETRVCPLARIMRRELKKRGIDSLKVVYSEEPPSRPSLAPQKTQIEQGDCAEGESQIKRRRDIPASNSFVPAVAGLIAAGEAVRDLIRSCAER